jgi:hypothetical protein
MIELVVVYCLSADPTHCVEKRDPTASYGDPVACMVSAQLSAQAYLAEHPKWQLSRWRCEVDTPKRLPA